MYVLTNIEANVTHKVLTGLGPDAGHDLPEPERKTLRDLIAKLGTSIDNGLPTDPPGVEAGLPTPPPGVDAGLPPPPPPGIDNTLPPPATPQPKK